MIKISGSKALPIAASIFQRAHSNDNPRKHLPQTRLSDTKSFFKSHAFYYGYIKDPDNGKKIDEVLLTFMRAPRTYTREDVVEIQAHSGSIGLRAIMELVLRQGARLAEPGEFTKRAFLNGRLDLTQAEAVIDVINAKTDTALHIATSQLDGKMKFGIEGLRNRLLEILTEIEAGIDFPEDVAEIADPNNITGILQHHILQSLDGLIKQSDSANILRDGLRLSVIGRPNVGKSSLLNRLIQKERAIVTSIPGTTRDLIEETFSIKGFNIKWKGEGINEVGYDEKSGRELIFVSDRYFRPAEVDELLCDSTKARNILGWKPKYSFNDLVNEMVENDCK